MTATDHELPSRRGLVFDMVVYGLGEVMARALNLLLLPLLTTYLQPAEYGIVALLTSLGFFVVPVFSLGIGGAIAPVYFEGNSPSRKQQTIVAALAILALAIAALAAVTYVCGPAVSQWLLNSREYVPLVYLTIAGSCFAILTIPFRQRLQFEQRSTTYATLSVLTLVVMTVATAVQVVVLRRGALGMIEASSFGQLFGLVVFAAAAGPGLKAPYQGAVARSVLALSLPLVPAFGAVFLLQHGAKYVIQWQRGLDEVGIYTAGANIGMAVSVAVTAFQGAWLPYFMRFEQRRENASEHFGQLLTYFVLGFGGLALTLFALAHPIVMLITQPPYHEAWRTIGLVATGQVLSGVFLVLLPGVYYAREVATVGVTQIARGRERTDSRGAAGPEAWRVRGRIGVCRELRDPRVEPAGME